MLSPTLLDAYLDAASEISRLAVGDPKASVASTTYKLPRLASQWDQVEGAPIGTRGGISVMHNFPADGEYVFARDAARDRPVSSSARDAPFDEKIEISIDGERVALIDVDRWMSQADPNGMELKTKPVQCAPARTASPPRSCSTFEGPVNDHIAPDRSQHRRHADRLASTASRTSRTCATSRSRARTTRPASPRRRAASRIFTCRPTHGRRSAPVRREDRHARSAARRTAGR